jgi:hypothetical protein
MGKRTCGVVCLLLMLMMTLAGCAGAVEWARVAPDMRMRCQSLRENSAFLGSRNSSQAVAVSSRSGGDRTALMEDCALQCYQRWASCTWALLYPRSRLGDCVPGRPCCLCEVRVGGGLSQGRGDTPRGWGEGAQSVLTAKARDGPERKQNHYFH